jgi:hypothetical protein
MVELSIKEREHLSGIVDWELPPMEIGPGWKKMNERNEVFDPVEELILIGAFRSEYI